MNKGLSLVELMIAMTAASLLVLVLYHMESLSNALHNEMREKWHCMQSLRGASLQLNDDLMQCACLLPQELKVAVEDKELFIAGVPVTAQHPGVQPHPAAPPPYYSLVVSSTARRVVLDTIDIDADGKADFWADLGMITESGPCLISHGYARGSPVVPMTSSHVIAPGERAIPAIHYELKSDGLYRNNQLIAEAIVYFEPQMHDGALVVVMRARYHETVKELSLSHPL